MNREVPYFSSPCPARKASLCIADADNKPLERAAWHAYQPLTGANSMLFLRSQPGYYFVASKIVAVP
jgi:hypothetical protein